MMNTTISEARTSKPTHQKPIHLMTPSEQVLWKQLKDCRFHGIRFCRQVYLGRYCVAFFSYEKNIVVEIDGQCDPLSLEEEQYEKQKKVYLKYHKYSVIRLHQAKIIKDTKSCLKELKTFIKTCP